MYPLSVLCRMYGLDLPTSSVIAGMRAAKAGVRPLRQSPPCFIYILVLRLCLPLNLLSRPWPTIRTLKCWLCFGFSSVSPPSSLFFSFLLFSCLPSGLIVIIVSSFCWSITWTYHRTDRTSKQQPCPLGTRPALECIFVFVSFLFLSFLFCFFCFRLS